MSGWEQVGAMIAVLTPLVGAPLTALTLYVKNVREQHAERIADLSNKAERLRQTTDSLTARVGELHRDGTTKEEWIRESMLARSERRWLTEAVVRLQGEVKSARETHSCDDRRPRNTNLNPDNSGDD